MPPVHLAQSSEDLVVANMGTSRHVSGISPNVNYQRDMQYVFKPTNWILGSIGIWPIVIRRIGRHASELTIVIGNLMLSFAMVPSILYIIYDEKDLNIRLKISGLLSFCIVAMIKYCILTLRRSKIYRCIEYVKSDWWQVTCTSDRELMLKYAAIGRKLTIIAALFMYGAGIIYYIILTPFFSGRKMNNQTIRPFVYPTYSKFHQSQISPIYEFVYLAHCMCGYTVYSITVGACGLIALFTTHACAQIQVIISRLKDLIDGKNFEILNVQRIGTIVEGHVRIIRFAAAVEEVLQEVCLVELTSCMCTICLLEYYCMLAWQEDDKASFVTYFLLFISFCFNLYILCYIGELLMEKSSQIRLICCMINWYKLSPSSARNLILIIIMSNHPIKFSAGRMIDLSLSTFGNVLKTTVAYLNFLRTLVM